MILTFPHGVRRNPNDTTYTDLTASVLTGPPTWVTDTDLDMPFVPDPLPEEQERIRARLSTEDATEEDRQKRAREALVALKAIREGTSTLTAAQQSRLFARVLVAIIIRLWRLREAE